MSWSLCFLCPLHQAHGICSPSAGCSPGEPACQQRGQRDVPARTCPLPTVPLGVPVLLLGTNRECKDPAAASHLILAVLGCTASHSQSSSSSSLVLSSSLEWWGENPGAGSALALSGGRSGSLMLQSGGKNSMMCSSSVFSVTSQGPVKYGKHWDRKPKVLGISFGSGSDL